jgi:hypothetical protein
MRAGKVTLSPRSRASTKNLLGIPGEHALARTATIRLDLMGDYEDRLVIGWGAWLVHAPIAPTTASITERAATRRGSHRFTQSIESELLAARVHRLVHSVRVLKKDVAGFEHERAVLERRRDGPTSDGSHGMPRVLRSATERSRARY